jgi:DNA polymerase elongation subunit (family B)
MLMPVLQTPEFDTGYEGALVLKPECGIYHEELIGVNDFNSLYPSCMISEGLSSDSKVWAKEYDLNGNKINTMGYLVDEFDNIIDVFGGNIVFKKEILI